MSHFETVLLSIEAKLMERFSVKLWMNSLSINKTTSSSFCRETATTVFLPRKVSSSQQWKGWQIFLNSSVHTPSIPLPLYLVTPIFMVVCPSKSHKYGQKGCFFITEWYRILDACPHILTAFQTTAGSLAIIYRVSPQNCCGNCEYCYNEVA